MSRWLLGLFAKVVVPCFHYVWYSSPTTWTQNRFLGYPIWQCPLDLQLYQELLFRLHPSYVIQTGVAEGGSLLYFATMLDLIKAPNNALVIGIDIRLTDSAKTLTHPRIRLIESSSTSAEVIAQVTTMVNGLPENGMVVLDSDHSRDHVFREMQLYQKFVGVNSYMVVEDTNINGHPVAPRSGPGPLEAVRIFMQESRDFVADDALWQRNLLSFHHHGWLKRTTASARG